MRIYKSLLCRMHRLTNSLHIIKKNDIYSCHNFDHHFNNSQVSYTSPTTRPYNNNNRLLNEEEYNVNMTTMVTRNNKKKVKIDELMDPDLNNEGKSANSELKEDTNKLGETESSHLHMSNVNTLESWANELSKENSTIHKAFEKI